MRLKVKFLSWSAGIPVAMLHKEVAEHAGVHTQGRILIKTCSKNPKELIGKMYVIHEPTFMKAAPLPEDAVINRIQYEKGDMLAVFDNGQRRVFKAANFAKKAAEILDSN